MLELDGATVYRGHIRALQDVTFDVGAGEVVALVGANGAGKTTTLQTVSGMHRLIPGSVMLDGERIDRLAPEEIVARGVAHVPENRGIFPSLTVEENLRMGAYLLRRDRAAWREGTERVTQMFPRLAERWEQRAGTLSGGEQQMLAIGRALLTRPRLLMVDEPSLGLAPLVVQQLFRVLADINRDGTAILLVEQYVTLALKIASRVVVLEKGRVAHVAPAAELREGGGDVMRSLYLGGGAGALKEVSSGRSRSAR